MKARKGEARRSSVLRRRTAWVAAGVGIVGLVGMSACSDDPVATARTRDARLLASLPVGIHPVLSIPGPGAGPAIHGREVRLYLWRRGVDEPVGAFQGEIRMAEGVRVMEATFPGGVMGAWNVVEPGRLRFAGVAPEGLGAGAALVLRMAPGTELNGEAFQVNVERVAAAETLSDLTGRVAHRDHPVVVRERPEALDVLVSSPVH